MLKLSPLQLKFVTEYVQDFNATRAAIRAGYSERAARQYAHQLLQRPKISKAIEEFHKKTDITNDRIIQEYARVAFLDPVSFYDDQGKFLSIKDMPTEARRAITALEEEEQFDSNGVPKGRLKKVRFASKIKALDSLARIRGLLNDTTDSGSPGFEVHIHLGQDNIRNVTPTATNGVITNGVPKLTEGE